MPTYSELKRSHTCGELRPEHIGQTIKLNGWVDGYRNLGGLLFLDLRDRYGITQVVINPETFSRDMLAEAEKARHEFVVAVIGTVAKRPAGTENAKLDTGAIEVQVSQFYILSTSKTPPFEISEHTNANEQLRLEYRYLDLRRKPLQERIRFRSQTGIAVRNHLVKEGFLEIETPLLIRSTPEGARDYVVPSRIYHGKFYALPQSPQLLKQILMVSGYDKYFQLARCLRDEDLRADRQPEHTQIDMEMSYVTPDDIFGVVERMLKVVYKELLNVDIKTPFPRYDYDEVMNKYGSDKPDARFGMELIDLSSVVRNCGFKVFVENVEKGGVVKGIVLPGGAAYSRKQIDDLTEFAKTKGASGLAYILRSDSEVKSPIAKFLSEAELNKIMETAQLKVGDALFIVSGRPTYTEETLGQLRLHLAKTHNLIPTNEWSMFFVTHFPLFYYNEEFKRFEAMHNIVSHPREIDMPLLDEGFNTSIPATDINHPWRRMKASQYDLVINGWEIASGGQRINRRDLQEKVLDILGIDNQRADRMFGFLLKALEYGAPPHAGIALGFDRLIAIMTGSDSIRDVMAFPKTAAAVSLMDGCPTAIEQDQLDELGLIVKGDKSG